MIFPSPQIKHRRRYATPHDLDCLQGLWYSPSGMAKLGRPGRSLLQFFVAIARMGFDGIDAPIGAISSSLYRVLGQTKSDRTVFRGLSDLEANGFILRRSFRIGENRMRCLVRFNESAFRFLTAKKEPTSEYINSQLTKSQSSDRMNINLRVNSCNSSSYKKPREREQDKFQNWSHPIVFTLICLLGKTPRDRKLIARAKTEIMAEQAGIGIIGGTGLEWSSFAKSWQKMAPAVREGIARADILPALRRSEGPPPASQHAQVEPTPRDWMLKDAPSEEITRPMTPPRREKSPAAPLREKSPAVPLREKSPAAPRREKSPAVPRREKSPAAPRLETSLSSDELKILEMAREKARR